ncbi:hypothetical protein U879_21035 [Defluviimonas sp. 20V17]|nr:hypothetical protein U879_21035 [Defluviimonas sp. 20V17]
MQGRGILARLVPSSVAIWAMTTAVEGWHRGTGRLTPVLRVPM